MTQVDFYILDDNAPGDRYLVACRLADKAFGQGRRVYIHTADPQDLRRLNNLLWSFRDQSFVPHGPIGESDPDITPVLLGCDRDPDNEDDVLINLAPEVPGFFSRFRRVAEIIDADVQVKQQGRQRYRFYKDRGYPLDTHELKQ